MATPEQVKNFVKAFVENDEEKFRTVALQIAANEAKLGNSETAQDLKKLVEQRRVSKVVDKNAQYGLLQDRSPSVSLSELVVNSEIENQINRIINEYRNRNKLQGFGLENTKKILLEGPIGTGKTFTALAL